MIRLEPIDPPWEQSQAFAAAVHRTVAKRIEARAKRELNAQRELFQPNPGDDAVPVRVTADDGGVLIEVSPPRESLAEEWNRRVKAIVSDEMKNLPIREMKAAVNESDPATRSSVG